MHNDTGSAQPVGTLAAAEPQEAPVTRSLWWSALGSAELLIGIHVDLIPMHLREKFYIGVLFCIGNGLLLLALLLLTDRRLRIAGWLLGIVVCLGEFGGFVASRTVGLPLGYHETWATETEDYLGLACLVLEAVFITAAVIALRRSATTSWRPGGLRDHP